MAKKKTPVKKDFWAELEAQDVRYLSAMPRSVPKNRVLVHSPGVSAKDEGKDRKPGESNFRAWTEKPSGGSSFAVIADGQVCRTIVREPQPTSGDRAAGHSEHGSEAPSWKPELFCGAN